MAEKKTETKKEETVKEVIVERTEDRDAGAGFGLAPGEVGKAEVPK